MQNRKILISGAGVAGTALAFWLKRFGFEPTVVEKASKLRKAGYAIDVRDAAVEVVERMGIMPGLKKAEVSKGRISFVNARHKIVGNIDTGLLQKFAPQGWIEVIRGDLVQLLYQTTLGQNIEYLFGNEICEINEGKDAVEVVFKNGPPRFFDLVIGADGLHSVVRKIAFGEVSILEKKLGYYVAAFTVNGFLGLGHENSGYIYNVPGKMAAVLHYSNSYESRSVAFLLFRNATEIPFYAFDTVKQKEIVRNAFEDEKWKVGAILRQMETADDFYLDSVSQIHMSGWSKGRIALCGDAGYCLSLLTGQGTSAALIGAYVLAGELKEAEGDYKQAFELYERRMRPFVEKEQQKIGASSNLLIPDTWIGIAIRNAFTHLLKVFYLVPPSLVRKSSRQPIFTLKDYGQT